MDEFESDLKVVRDSGIDLSTEIHNYFMFMPFWKLFWANDTITKGLEQRINSNTTLIPEFQVHIG